MVAGVVQYWRLAFGWSEIGGTKQSIGHSRTAWTAQIDCILVLDSEKKARILKLEACKIDV